MIVQLIPRLHIIFYLYNVFIFNFSRSVEYVVECGDSEGMRMWLLTIQGNIRNYTMSLSALAERNRFVLNKICFYTIIL